MVSLKTLYLKTKNLSLLLVEDYKPLRDDMAEVLGDLFGVVEVACDGKEALQSYIDYHRNHQKYFDLIISDIQMPRMNGVDLCKAIKNLNYDQKIIIISAYSDKDYLLSLINLGISQFIPKPFEHEEFIDTLCAVAKKFDPPKKQPSNRDIISLAEGFSWDSKKDILSSKEEFVQLTHYETILMRFLIKKSGSVCSNQDILNNLYDNGIDMSESGIRNLVFKLRKKLPEATINSLYGVGYRLNTIEV